VWYGGQESLGLVEKHSLAEDKVTVWLLDQKLQICCKVEEVWLAELQGAMSPAPPVEHGAQVPAYRQKHRCPKEVCGDGEGASVGFLVMRGMWGPRYLDSRYVE
jgi:hypothetical protein